MQREQVVTAYHALQAAEMVYAEYPTYLNHTHVIRAQRAYYTCLAKYNEHHYPHGIARVRRAEALRQRAYANRHHCTSDPVWQALALHQVRRAIRVRLQAIALTDYENTDEPPRAPAARPKRLPRVRHPITGRMLYYDVATDTYHKRHPA